jgi:GH24 family phage-related lysozyme (muramidase)
MTNPFEIIFNPTQAAPKKKLGEPIELGNVDLYAQPKVKNPDGSTSTVDSSSYNFGDVEVLLPSVTPDGRHLKGADDIVGEYKKTGRHLGKFASPEDATAYASKLHEDYAAGVYDIPQTLMKAASAYIASNEGRRTKPYEDKSSLRSKGKRTVGIGHLITDPKDDREMTEPEIEQLFVSDLTEKVTQARAKIGKRFDTLPEPAQVAIIDGFFRGDMSGSPEALKLIKAGKLDEAATEYLNNAEYRASVKSNAEGKPHGVAGRMERNAAALRAAVVRGVLSDAPPIIAQPLENE